MQKYNQQCQPDNQVKITFNTCNYLMIDKQEIMKSNDPLVY